MSMDDFKENIREKQEHDAVKRALSLPGSRLSKVNSYRYSGLEETINAVKFEYPTACYIQLLNLDNLDADGFPEVHLQKIREVSITASSTNSYGRRGNLIGAEVKDVSFSYRVVLVFVKHGEFKMVAQNVEAHSTKGYGYYG